MATTVSKLSGNILSVSAAWTELAGLRLLLEVNILVLFSEVLNALSNF
jgi:hypothetical protein